MQISLDLFTLQIVLTLAFVITFAVMVNIWSINQSSPGVRWWLGASAVGAVSFISVPIALALWGREALSNALMVNNAGSMTMLLLLLAGSLRFRGWLRHRNHAWGLLLVVPVVTMAYLNRDDDVRRYLMHDGLCVLLLTATAATLMWQRPAAERRVLALASVFIGLMGLALGARWWCVWHIPAGVQATELPVQGWVHLTITTFVIGWTYCVSLVCYQRAQGQVLEMAHQDALTHLPNRRYFDELLDRDVARGERTGQAFAVVMIDLNRFKQVNDQYGHAVGDGLLMEVAQRLRVFGRGGDVAARLGGDEFALLVHDVDDVGQLARTQERLRRVLNGPAKVQGRSLEIDTSVGAAMWPLDGVQPGELMVQADQRMYADKRLQKTLRAQALRGSGSPAPTNSQFDSRISP